MADSQWQRWLLDTADSREQARLLNLSTSSRWFVWFLAAFLSCLICWSFWAELDEVVTGYGRVIPDSRVQLVQSLDGGILKSIRVKEGDKVSEGETLLQVDETRYRSSLMMNETELEGAAWEVARLEAELNSIIEDREGWSVQRSPLVLPDARQIDSVEQVHQQNAILNERLDSLVSQREVLGRQVEQKNQELLEHRQKTDTLTRSVALIHEELELKEPLAQEGLVTRVDIINLKRRANELKGELANSQLMEPRLVSALAESSSRHKGLLIRYRADVQKELQAARERLEKLSEGQMGLQDRVQKTTLVSPVSGLVKVVHLNTPGSVIQPGANIVEIVPTGDRLVVEIQVQPADIAFLRPGQGARIKLTAYENASYNSLTGKVESISADTLEDNRGQTYYRVKIVVPDKLELHEREASPTLLSGMTAVVDILTGKQTVMGYLLSPVSKAVR